MVGVSCRIVAFVGNRLNNLLCFVLYIATCWPCACTLLRWIYPWKGTLRHHTGKWSRGGMLKLKMFRRWCNSLQKNLFLILEAHNIFYHIRCMRWRWGHRKCKAGSKCKCNFMEVEWGGEWLGVMIQLGTSGALPIPPPFSPRLHLVFVVHSSRVGTHHNLVHRPSSTP